MQLELVQYIESSRSYSLTLNLLRQLGPSFVVAVSTPSPVNKACNEFKLILKARGTFDDTNGHTLIDLYSNASTLLSATATRSFYLAFGAAGALLTVIEEDFPFKVLPGTLTVVCKGPDDFLQVDCATAQVGLNLSKKTSIQCRSVMKSAFFEAVLSLPTNGAEAHT